MTDALKLSIARMPIRRYASIDEFAADLDRYAAQAVAAGSRLLLLPELACVGLLWMEPGAAAATVATLADFYDRGLTRHLATYRDALARVARTRGVWLAGASYWHVRGGSGVNTAFMVDPDGSVSEQDKLHPTRPEQLIGTVGGESLHTFVVDGVRVGLLVCYDIQFPELTRHLVADGVEVVLVPSLTSERGFWRVRHCAQARAIESQIYVCVSPLVGDLALPQDHPLTCTGTAYVACPIDNRFAITDGVYAEATDASDELLHTTLDLAKLRLARSKSEIQQLKDRRPDLYAGLRR